MTDVRVIGYSERGILNSLLYEIRYSKNSVGLLNELIKKATFPFTDKPLPIETAEILVDQSLSEFGTSDAIILFSSGAKKACSL